MPTEVRARTRARPVRRHSLHPNRRMHCDDESDESSESTSPQSRKCIIRAQSMEKPRKAPAHVNQRAKSVCFKEATSRSEDKENDVKHSINNPPKTPSYNLEKGVLKAQVQTPGPGTKTTGRRTLYIQDAIYEVSDTEGISSLN